MSKQKVVLISAYTCNPQKGSESGVGWTWSMAAASLDEIAVHVLAREKDRTDIVAALQDLPAGQPKPVFHYLELWRLERLTTLLKLRRAYYLAWQLAAVFHLRRIARSSSASIVHHLAFASDVLPAAAAFVPGTRFVWGPVGGGAKTPTAGYRYLGIKDRLGEAARSLGHWALYGTVGRITRRRADLVVAQNSDCCRDVPANRREVHPNALIEHVTQDETFDLRTQHASSTDPESREEIRLAVFVGRLLGFKGMGIAVRAIAQSPGWGLAIIGAGPEETRLRALVGRLGVSDRVSFLGQLERPSVFAALAQADALVFPSMHDQCGWVVPEAQACGCPVICLEVGGPASLSLAAPHVLVPARGDLVQGFVKAIAECPPRYEPLNAWGPERAQELLARWYGEQP